MSTRAHFTSADIELLAHDNKRREVIDGELYVSPQPRAEHQATCTQIAYLLQGWSLRTRLGQTLVAPGLVFADDDNVAPDVVWISRALPLGARRLRPPPPRS
jgi:Uma2 family endonuclease